MVVVVVEAVEKVVKSLGASPLFPIARFSRHNKKTRLTKRVFCVTLGLPRTAHQFVVANEL
jgi:hypothetical protein